MLLWLGQRRSRWAVCHGRSTDLIQAVPFEKLVQRRARDADAEGGLDKGDQIGAAGIGVLDEEGSDGTGVTGQEFAIRTAIEAVVGLLNDFFAREVLLPRGSGPADAQQPCELCDLQSGGGVK